MEPILTIEEWCWWRPQDSESITWPSTIGRVYDVFWSIDGKSWTSTATQNGSGVAQSYSLDLDAIDAADGIAGNLDRLMVRIEVALPE